MKDLSHATRRSVLLGGGAALAAAAGSLHPATAQQLTPATIAFGWISNVQYAGFWMALEEGYFEEEGIKADYLSGGPNAPDTLVSLSANDAQLATANWLPLLDAHAEGNDFVILGATWSTSPAALMFMPDRPIRSPEDLVGARILAQTPSDSTIIDSILSRAGLPLDYEVLQTGFSPEPLLAGDGDAYFAFATNQPISLEKMGLVEGEDFHVTLLADLGYEVKQGLIVTRHQWLEENRGLVVGYLRALVRGWRSALAEPERATDLVVSTYGADLGLDRAQQLRQMELQTPLVRPDEGGRLLMFDPAIISGAMTEVAETSGREIPPLEDVLDLGPLEDAHTSL